MKQQSEQGGGEHLDLKVCWRAVHRNMAKANPYGIVSPSTHKVLTENLISISGFSLRLFGASQTCTADFLTIVKKIRVQLRQRETTIQISCESQMEPYFLRFWGFRFTKAVQEILRMIINANG